MIDIGPQKQPASVAKIMAEQKYVLNELERCCECDGSGNRYQQDWDESNYWKAFTCRKCQGKGYRREVLSS